MNQQCIDAIKQIIKHFNLDCTVDTFADCQKINGYYFSKYNFLSEDFIREFQDKVNWYYISQYQQLSESFIREFQDKVCWVWISSSQKLSENFIKEFKDKVDWENISESQKLSENFIREFQDDVLWYNISIYQTLSKDFIREFQDKIDINLYNQVHRTLTYKQKLQEVKEYCEKYKLEFDIDNKCFYAYRKHNRSNRGIFNGGPYELNIYYRDYHLDMRKNEEDSFGLGIWPKNEDVNCKVKVKIEDWGVAVNRDTQVDGEDGKARVWGFEIVEKF